MAKTKNIDVADLGSENDLPESDNNITSFPEEWKDEFEGLLFLGRLQSEVTSIPFHKFVVRTLTINEKLEVSLIAKPFIETIGYGRAYKAAVVAAGLVSVDGRDLVPLSKNINIIRQKYDYIVNNWYDILIETLYDQIGILENRSVIVLQELGIIEPIVPTSIYADEQVDNDSPKDGNQTST